MVAGLFQGHGEAGGCHRGGALGRAPVVLAEVGVGGRDGLLDSQGLSSALCYWVCSTVHFQSGEYWVDHSGVPFHGSSFFSTFLFYHVSFYHLCLVFENDYLISILNKSFSWITLEKGFLVGGAEIIFPSLQTSFGRGLIG